MTLTTQEQAVIDACAGRLDRIPFRQLEFVMVEAGRHEVSALAAWRIHEAISLDPRRAEPEQLDAVKATVAASVIQEGLEREEIARVFGLLEGIPVLLLKGHGIAARWYPAGARLDRDIDLYVPRSRYYQAKEAIRTLGYAMVPSEDEAMQLSHSKDVGFFRCDQDGHPWSVELHVRLTEPGAPDLDPASLLSQAEVLDIGGSTVPAPSPEHSLLLMALNLRKHRFARLKTVVDIARVLESDRQLDWESLGRESKAAGYLGLVRHAIQLSCEVMGVPELARSALDGLPDARAMAPSRGLSRIATVDTVFGESRQQEPAKRVSGLIPFLSLDKPVATLHLVLGRLSLSPEMASYYRLQGDPGSNYYRNRFQYWRDTAGRLWRAAATLFRTARDQEVTGPT